MVDWVTVSSLATAGGTLVLAFATFSATRSSNRSARVAERALLAGLRPVFSPSRLSDEPEKVLFQELNWFRLRGGHAIAEFTDDVVYLIIGVRNAGTGMGVLRGWRVVPRILFGADREMPSLDSFRPQTRDIYIPAGDSSFWQGAMRDPDDPERPAVIEAIKNHTSITIDILYGDAEGGQRIITRFALIPVGEDDWLTSVSRHWNIDRDDPR
jgi:hypothetical protein